MVLFSFLHEIEGSAVATLSLATTSARGHAGPNARACFEAAQNALLLATADDYAYAGALAYVYFMRKDLRFEEVAAEAFGPATVGDGEWSFDEALAEMEATSARFGPVNTGLIARARAELEARPNGPDNWLGRSPAQVLAAQGRKFGNAEATARIGDPARWRAVYAHLCRQTHTRLRLRARNVIGSVNGPIRFQFDPLLTDDDAENMVMMVAASVNFGFMAVSIRAARAPST
jgi:hypothetical protein